MPRNIRLEGGGARGVIRNTQGGGQGHLSGGRAVVFGVYSRLTEEKKRSDSKSRG